MVENSYYVRVYIMAVHSLISVESLALAFVISIEFAEKRFILFIRLHDSKSTAPLVKFEASHIP